MSKLKKCVAVFCLFCVLVYSMSAPARAIAGVDDLVVAGVTVMTMGLLGSFGIMALQASGAGDALLSAAESAGQTAKEYGQTLFASYARSQNITAGQSVQLAAQGISYLEDGTIVFNRAVSNMMDGFVNWAWDHTGGKLVDSAVPVSVQFDFPDTISKTLYASNGQAVELNLIKCTSFNSSLRDWYVNESFYVNYNGVRFYPGQSSSTLGYLDECVIYYTYVGNNSVYMFALPFNEEITTNQNAFVWALFTNGYGTLNGGGFYFRQLSGVYDGLDTPLYYNYFGPSGMSNGNLPISTFSSASLLLGFTWRDVFGDVEQVPNYDTNLGVFDGVNDSPDTNIGSYLDTGQLLQDLDAGTAAELANGGTIDIQDWIDCIIDLIAEGEAVVPVDVVGGDVLDVPLEHVGEMDIPVEIDTPTEGVVEQDVAISTSVDGLDDYTLDLLDFFPFCIPFDIYDMLSMFSAQRQAPVVNWRFYVPGICDETIELDFSIFDSAAQVLRSVELVAAAIGLAFVTKKLIQGGD